MSLKWLQWLAHPEIALNQFGIPVNLQKQPDLIDCKTCSGHNAQCMLKTCMFACEVRPPDSRLVSSFQIVSSHLVLMTARDTAGVSITVATSYES